MRRPLVIAAVLGVLAISACGTVDEFSFADFVQTPPGLVSAQVHQMDDEQVGQLLSEVRLRYDSYVELRGRLPVGPLLDDVSFGICPSSSVFPAPDQFFVIDVPCQLQAQGLSVAAGGDRRCGADRSTRGPTVRGQPVSVLWRRTGGDSQR